MQVYSGERWNNRRSEGPSSGSLGPHSRVSLRARKGLIISRPVMSSWCRPDAQIVNNVRPFGETSVILAWFCPLCWPYVPIFLPFKAPLLPALPMSAKQISLHNFRRPVKENTPPIWDIIVRAIRCEFWEGRLTLSMPKLTWRKCVCVCMYNVVRWWRDFFGKLSWNLWLRKACLS